MALTEEQQSDAMARKKPKSSYLEVKEITKLLKGGYGKTANVRYSQLRNAKRKVITRPQYVHLMTLFGQYDGLHTARIIFDDMLRRHKSNAYVYNMMLKQYANHGHPYKCYELLQEMEGRFVTPDVYSYSIAIQAFVKHHNMQRASQLYDEMIQHGFRPVSATYDALMRGFLELGEHRRVLDIDSQRWGVEPSRRTTESWAMLIRAHAALGELAEADLAYESMLEDFKEYREWHEEEAKRAEREETDYAQLDKAHLVTLGWEEGDIDAEDGDNLGQDEDEDTGRRAPRPVSTIFEVGDVDSEGFDWANGEADVGDYRTGPKGHGSVYADETDEFGDEDEESADFDEDIATPRPAKVWPETVSLVEDGFLAMVVTRCTSAADVFKVLDDARYSPVPLSIQLLGPCMTAIAAMGDRQQIEKMLAELDQLELQSVPDVVNARLRAVAALDNLAAVQDIHEQAINKKVESDKYTLNLMTDAYRKQRQPELAEQLLDDFRSIAIKANLGTYNILLNMYVDLGDPKSAERIFKRMLRRGLRPNARSFSFLMRAYLAKDRTSDVLRAYKMMKHESVTPNLDVLDAVLEAAVRGNDLDLAEDVSRTFERLGLEWSETTFRALAGLYAQVSDDPTEELVDLAERLQASDEPSHDAVKAVCEALERTGNRARAEVLRECILERAGTDEVAAHDTYEGEGLGLESL